jgi:ELWxxDGT repeat protein
MTFEMLEERIVLDAANYDGNWHNLEGDYWFRYDIATGDEYWWYEDSGDPSAVPHYVAWEASTGQWWADTNFDWQSPVWNTFGDANQPAADDDDVSTFWYDGNQHLIQAGLYYQFDITAFEGNWDVGPYGDFLYDYNAEDWFLNGTTLWQAPESSDLIYNIYDGSWYMFSDGTWFRYSASEDAAYWWSTGSGIETYLAYEYQTDQWWADADGYYAGGGWEKFGAAGDHPSEFYFDGASHEIATDVWFEWDGTYGYWSDTGGYTDRHDFYTGEWWEYNAMSWDFVGVWDARLAADILNGAPSSSPTDMVEMGGLLYFSAYDATYGTELWSYDPATETASRITDINTSGSSDPEWLTVADGVLYFVATDGGVTYGQELWSYDTTNGIQVYDLRSGTFGSSPQDLAELDGVLYFRARPDSNDQDLHSYDPINGVVNININPSGNCWPQDIVGIDGLLYFTAQISNNYQLFVYDPVAGTYNEYIINSTSSSSPEQFTELDGLVYFRADDGIHGVELWVFDPVGGTTSLAYDIKTGSNGSYLTDLTAYDGRLYFRASDFTNGSELWTYDPVSGTAWMVDNLMPGYNEGSFPEEMTVYNGLLYFTAEGEGYDRELYAYDSATDEISLVANIGAGGLSSDPVYYIVFDGSLYFSAFTVDYGYELWYINTTV